MIEAALVLLLIFGFILLTGGTGKKPHSTKQPHKPPPLSDDFLIDTLADQARSLNDDAKKKLIKTVARQIKRSKRR